MVLTMPDDHTKKQPASSSTVSSAKPADHPALDLAAALLRAFGRHAIATENMTAGQLDELCEQWARHILIGAPSPGGNGTKAAALTIDQRDWEGARRFFTDVRRGEQGFVNTRIGDFRDMLWVFIHGLRATFVDDQAADKAVNSQLDHLKQALETNSIDALRREVVGSLVLIGRTLEERRKRQSAQMEQLGEQLKSLRGELVSAQQAMALDPMTRLYNRSSFDEMLSKTVEISLLSGQAAVLLMADVDDFKGINDSHGHQAGDAVIGEMARVLLRTFPRKTDFVARYAGDEFIVILQDTSAAEGKMLADRLLKTVRAVRITLPSAEELTFTISAGVAAIKRDDAPEDWLRRVDEALYTAKQAGRNRAHLRDEADVIPPP